jgi:hypothetical protein
MARQSFRGAGGAGAVIVHAYERADAGEYEITPVSEPVLAAGDRRIEGALAIVASGVLVVVGLVVASWTLAG